MKECFSGALCISKLTWKNSVKYSVLLCDSENAEYHLAQAGK